MAKEICRCFVFYLLPVSFQEVNTVKLQEKRPLLFSEVAGFLLTLRKGGGRKTAKLYINRFVLGV